MGLALDQPVHHDVFPDAKINGRLQKLQLGRRGRGADPCKLGNVEPLPAGTGGLDGNMEIRGYRTRRARAEAQTVEVKEAPRREDEEQSAAEQCEGGVEWDDEGC